MTRLDESFASLRQLGATYADTLTLVRWAEGSTTGRTVTFRLPDGPEADAVHPFKGLPAHPKDGQRFKALLIMIGDVAEEPIESAAPPLARAVDAGALSTAEAESGGSAPKPQEEKQPASYTTKAGIACSEPLFWRWLREVGLADVHDAKEAAVFVRGHCHVNSRSELATNVDAAARFDPLWRRYQEYKNSGHFALEAAQ